MVHTVRRGQRTSNGSEITLRMLLLLVLSVLSSEAACLLLMASKVPARASANIPKAMHERRPERVIALWIIRVSFLCI